MGTMVGIYIEDENRIVSLAKKTILNLDQIRRLRASNLRYCVGDDQFYCPDDEILRKYKRLCWARITPLVSDISEFDVNEILARYPSGHLNFDDVEEADIRIGDRYAKRFEEKNGRFVSVPEFCSQLLVDAIADNPEVLAQVKRCDFENLCAELFVRRGFKVDLFRKTKDGGIDFLAIQDEKVDPVIFAVQTRQPDIRKGKSRKSVGIAAVQQVYGATAAWDLDGCVVISGSTCSREAKKFSQWKPGEIILNDSRDVLHWIERYRWNREE